MDKDSLNLLFNKLSVLEKSLATPTDASSEIMKVTPYNGFGYGLSLLIVFIFAMIMYRQWQKSESYNKLLNKNVLEFQAEWLKFSVEMQVTMQNGQFAITRSLAVTEDSIVVKKHLAEKLCELTTRVDYLLHIIEGKK